MTIYNIVTTQAQRRLQEWRDDEDNRRGETCVNYGTCRAQLETQFVLHSKHRGI